MLLEAAEDDRIEGRTRFQKLVFLTQKRTGDDDLYNFFRYDYGPFSKKLLTELEVLADDGFIEIARETTLGGSTRYDYSLTDEGRKVVEGMPEDDRISEIHEAAQEVTSEYSGTSLRALLQTIYEKFPQYKESSVYNY